MVSLFPLNNALDNRPLILIEDKARMAKAQRKDSNNDKHALQTDEETLLGHGLAAIPFPQLVAPKDAAGEDEQDGGGQASEEDVHTLGTDVRRSFDVTGTSLGGGGGRLAEEANHVVGEEEAEDEDDDDLEDEAGKGEVDAGLVGAGGDGGEGAAGGLEDEADYVGGDEDPVVEARGEAGEGGGEVGDCFGEGYVDCCGVEDGAGGDEDWGCVSS